MMGLAGCLSRGMSDSRRSLLYAHLAVSSTNSNQAFLN